MRGPAPGGRLNCRLRPARYLGSLRPDGVDCVGLSMNARGQAVAVWKGAFLAEAARFEFGHGWTRLQMPRTLRFGAFLSWWGP